MTSCPLLRWIPWETGGFACSWLIEAVILVGRWPMLPLHPTTSPKSQCRCLEQPEYLGTACPGEANKELLPELLAVVHPSAHRGWDVTTDVEDRTKISHILFKYMSPVLSTPTRLVFLSCFKISSLTFLGLFEQNILKHYNCEIQMIDQ